MLIVKWFKAHGLTVLGIVFLTAACVVSNLIYLNIIAIEKNRIVEFDNFSNNLSMSAKEIMVRDDGFVILATMIRTFSDMSHVRYVEYYQGRGSAMKAGENQLQDVEVINKLKALNGAQTYKKGDRLYIRKELPRYDVLEEKGSFYIVFDLSEYVKKREQILTAIGLILLFALVLSVLMILLERRNISLIQTKVDLENEKRKSSNLIKAITHDAKHYLTVINLRLHGILRQKQKGKGLDNLKEDLELALDNTKAINTFLDSLVENERIMRGEEALLPARVNVPEIISTVINDLDVQLKNKKMRCSVVYNDSKVPEAWIDESALRRVLMNLMTNAIKFSPDNSALEIKLEKKHGRFWIHVKDYGKGIDVKDWEHVFEPFVRLDSKVKGTGQGLTTARRLIELSGGKLKIKESTLNKGTTFSFSMLIAK